MPSPFHSPEGVRYAQAGAYFVTVCTYKRGCVFGDLVDGEMQLNDWGEIARDEWVRTSVVRPNVELDAFVVMPNHVHGILCIVADGRGTARRAPTVTRFGYPVPGSLPTIIRAFKSATTKRVNETRQAPAPPLWQHSYYEHVIRDQNEWNRIREYISTNPARWAEDVNNPAYNYDARTKPLEAEFRGIFRKLGYRRFANDLFTGV